MLDKKFMCADVIFHKIAKLMTRYYNKYVYNTDPIRLLLGIRNSFSGSANSFSGSANSVSGSANSVSGSTNSVSGSTKSISRTANTLLRNVKQFNRKELFSKK